MKATLFAALLALARPCAAYDTIKFLDPLKLDKAVRAGALAVGGEDRLYAIDGKAGQILIYGPGPDRVLLKTAGGGSKKEALREPMGLTVGPKGRVFVADTGNSRVVILDADGNFLSAFGAKGSEAGMLSYPESVAVGADGRIYVADTGNSRVQVFTEEGIFLYGFWTYGKAGVKQNLKAPSKVAVDLSDRVYVLDRSLERILVFDPHQAFLADLNLAVKDFAVDRYGYLYALDAYNSKVLEANAYGDSAGKVLGRFGSVGAGTGQFKKPEGLALSPSGTIFVTDSGNGRIQRIELANKQKTAWLPPNLETKMIVSGPSASWSAPAEAIAASGSDLYAYFPKEGRFMVYDEKGEEKARFGRRTGKAAEATKDAKGFAVSETLGVYVADTPNNRIQHFAKDGTWKENIAESTGFFDSSKKEGRVKAPRGVAINEDGTIYVIDSGNRRIDAFSPEGVFISAIGPVVGSYELVEPVAVAWDPAHFIYFADKGLKKVFKCEPSGAFVAAWGEEGSGPGQFQSPAALSFDGNNYVYVLDDELRRVSVFDKDGRWMTDLFSGGKGEHELMAPAGLAVSGSRLVISDKGKGRIVSFDLHPSLGAPASISTETKEGMALLSWSPVADPWTAQYRVYRSTSLYGHYEEAGVSAETSFRDSKVAAFQKYYYKVATEAKTKDIGPASNPLELFVAGSSNRSTVEISSVVIGNIFSANYKWYLKNPVGVAVVTNNVNLPYQKVKLTFRLKDFMDFGYDTEFKTLEPMQKVEVPLIATLNNKILEVTEDTPIQAEFTLTYFEEGQERKVSLTKPLRVYSRNAITWEDPQRIANFITPKDTPILEFAREVLRDAPKNPAADGLGENVVAAVQLWDALAEHGVKFFTNPNNPYETVSEDTNFPVDYTQFPRETLKRKSGQCDDLTTLLISMLSGAKVPAAILDYPGHMALLFDTEASDVAEAGLPEEYLVSYKGTWWVPLESTLVGQPFPEAVRKAAYAYKTEEAKGKARIIDVGKAWETFEPATLPAADFTFTVPKAEARQKRFDGEIAALFEEQYKALKKTFDAALKKDPEDVDARLGLGLLEYRAGHKEGAVKQFADVLAADPKNPSALMNLGNVNFMDGDYASAEKRYLSAAEADPDDADVWMNLVKTEMRLEQKEKAAEYGKKATALEAGLAPAVETLLGGK